MKRVTLGVVAAAALFAAAQATAQQSPPTQPPAKQPQAAIAHTNLKIGDVAPDFTLPDNAGHQVHLADYRGKKNVVLAFYVLAFTGG